MVTSVDPTTLFPGIIDCDDIALLAAKYEEGVMLCITPDDDVEGVEIVCWRVVEVPSPEIIDFEDLLLSKGIV